MFRRSTRKIERFAIGAHLHRRAQFDRVGAQRQKRSPLGMMMVEGVCCASGASCIRYERAPLLAIFRARRSGAREICKLSRPTYQGSPVNNATSFPAQNHLLGQLPHAEQQRWFPQLEHPDCGLALDYETNRDIYCAEDCPTYKQVSSKRLKEAASRRSAFYLYETLARQRALLAFQ